MTPRTIRSRLLLLPLLGAGCAGSVPEEAGEAGRPTPETPTPRTPMAAAPAGATPVLEGRVWRLTRVQYDNTVRALLGDTSAPARKFLPEEGGTGFRNAEPALALQDTNMAEFSRAAMKLAAETVVNPERLASVFPCGVERLGDAACGQSFVVAFGRRAFRRPLTDEETARYQALFALALGLLDGRAAVQTVIEAMLQSPHFLYRSELGEGPRDAAGRVRLTDHELAAQLSYTFWNGMPDPALDEAADARRLVVPGEIERQARRLVADQRARPVVVDLFAQIMDYAAVAEATKSGVFSKPFSAAKSSLAEETARFVQEIVWSDEPTVARLLTAPLTFVNAALAPLYGVTGVQAGEWRRVELPGADRAGLLTQAGLMVTTSHAAGTSPVLRGKFVSERLLCVEIPDPPPEVMASEPAPSPAKTTRQRYAQHATDPACTACHRLLDAPGYAFEHLDPIGTVRRTENGIAVDTTGALHGSDVDGPFANVEELARKLASSAQVRACLARQVFRWSSGRMERPEDRPALDELAMRAGSSMQELLVAPALSQRFVLRQID